MMIRSFASATIPTRSWASNLCCRSELTYVCLVFSRLLTIRTEDRRATRVAFLTLFGLLAGHAMLETARDALFLAKLPASQLPWAYLTFIFQPTRKAIKGRVLAGRSFASSEDDHGRRSQQAR